MRAKSILDLLLFTIAPINFSTTEVVPIYENLSICTIGQIHLSVREVLPGCESSLKSAVVKPNKNILKAKTEILLVPSVRGVPFLVIRSIWPLAVISL